MIASLQRSFAALGARHQAMFFMLGSAFFFSVNTTMTKQLALEGFNPFQIAFARSFFAFLVLMPFLLRGGFRAFHTKHPWVHFTRAFAGASALFLGVHAAALLPLADMTALTFTTPLFTVILAFFLLKEQVRWRRWVATLVGFAGVLVMVQPGASAFDPNAFFALGNAFLVALASSMIRRFPPGESQAVMLFYFCVTSVVISAPFAFVAWKSPDFWQWAMLVGVGTVGALAHSLFLSAYKKAEASFVAPFDYTKLIFAIAWGLLFFGQAPPWATLAGALLIVSSTLYIARRESKLGKAPTKTEEAL